MNVNHVVLHFCRTYTLICLGILLLQACQPMPPKHNLPEQDIAATLQSALQQKPILTPELTPTPPSPRLPKLTPTPPSPRLPTLRTRFDINVNDVPAKVFFNSLVTDTPYNIVVHPDVSGTIALQLKNVTIADVLEAVRDTYGYVYKVTSFGLQILPARLHTRLFEVNYLNLARQGQSNISVSAGQLTQNRAREDSRDNDGVVSDTTVNPRPSGSHISTLQLPTPFWEEIELTIRAMLNGEAGRQVVVNRQSGIVMVRAMPHELDDIETFLARTQAISRRQVILDAKIMEVTLNDGYQAGINWAFLARQNNAGMVAGQTGGGGLTANPATNETNITDVLDSNGDFAPFTSANGLNASRFGGIFSAALYIRDFAAFIELLETQGNVQVLSSPRIATLNNQKAVIKVGSDEYFVTDVDNNASTTVTGITIGGPSVELTPFFSGIALDVTPQISGDGEILLHVHPSVSEVIDQQKSLLIDDGELNLPLAFSTVRESDSVIRARDGQIVVIGGLMQNKASESVASTPLLGELPGIGTLFRHTRQTASKSELVILLRPSIVTSDHQWRTTLQHITARFAELERGFHLGGKIEVFGSLAEVETWVVDLEVE